MSPEPCKRDALLTVQVHVSVGQLQVFTQILANTILDRDSSATGLWRQTLPA